MATLGAGGRDGDAGINATGKPFSASFVTSCESSVESSDQWDVRENDVNEVLRHILKASAGYYSLSPSYWKHRYDGWRYNLDKHSKYHALGMTVWKSQSSLSPS